MIDFVQVGKKITTLRRDNDWSQEDLASKLFITRQCLSKWEVGSSIPSIEMLLELSKIFSISIEELLCLDQNIVVDEEDIFKGHERLFIINKIISKEIEVNIPNIFYQLSPSERMMILRAINEEKVECDRRELMVKLTPSEIKFIGGNNYEIEKSNNQW